MFIRSNEKNKNKLSQIIRFWWYMRALTVKPTNCFFKMSLSLRKLKTSVFFIWFWSFLTNYAFLYTEKCEESQNFARKLVFTKTTYLHLLARSERKKLAWTSDQTWTRPNCVQVDASEPQVGGQTSLKQTLSCGNWSSFCAFLLIRLYNYNQLMIMRLP